jgi:hypothetical protein
MKIRAFMGVAALMSALQIAGCATLKSYWPWTKSPAPPSPLKVLKEVPSEIPPSTVVEEPAIPKRRTHRARAKEPPAITTAPAQTPAGSPTRGGTNVTIEDNNGYRVQAQALLADADTRLSQIDRSKLNAENSSAYNQASDLASAAHKAMAQNDYLAASGLARKSALLTAQVAERAPSR